jgi:hypothetical protein
MPPEIGRFEPVELLARSFLRCEGAGALPPPLLKLTTLPPRSSASSR